MTLSVLDSLIVKVYVIGHRGLVGASLLRNAPKNIDIVTKERYELDIENLKEVSNFIKIENPTSIILAAAKVGGIGANAKNQFEFLLRNLTIQNSVIQAAHENGVRNFIFLGSSCIYPKFAPQPIKEESLLTGPLEATNEAYALAKISGVRMMRAIYDESGKNYFSLMPSNLYGPNDNFDPASSHVPAALLRRFHEAKLANLDTVTVWGSGRPRREFMHVDDLAKACWYLLQKDLGGKLINVGSGSDVSIKEFALLIARVTGYQGRIRYDLEKPDGTPRKLLDISQITSLGWRAKIDLESGLFSTYKWFEENWKRGSIRGKK